MSDARYKVVFQEVAPGRNPKEVRANLADLFQKDPAELDYFFSGEPVVLEENTDEETATKLKTAINGAGGVGMMERVWDAGDELSLELEAGGDEEEDEHTPEVVQMDCPKCGHIQPRSEKCVKCGLVIAEYYKSLPDEEPVQSAEERAAEGPKITPIYIEAKRTWPKTLAKWIIVLAILGTGAWFAKENIRERDETPLPYPDAVIEDLMPSRLSRAFKKTPVGLKDIHPGRFFIVDTDGNKHPVSKELDIITRFLDMSRTLQGARTIIVLRERPNEYDARDITLDALLIDPAVPTRPELVRARNATRSSEEYPMGATLVWSEIIGEPRVYKEEQATRVELVKKILAAIKAHK